MSPCSEVANGSGDISLRWPDMAVMITKAEELRAPENPPLPLRPKVIAPYFHGPYMQKRSNSPFCTPPRNARHSSDVNRRTAPWDSLLLRTPISPPGRLATSTQLPLAKLRELLTQLKPEFSG